MTVNGALTPNGRPARTESDEYGRFVRRVLGAYSRRVADRDIEGLAGLAQLAGDIDSYMVVVVANLRSEAGGGYSWADIGRALGITRQAAQQRYSKRIGEAGR